MEVLKLIGKNFANLLKVKTILSLAVIFTTCVLTFKNVISVEAFMACKCDNNILLYKKRGQGGVTMEEELVENTELVEYTDENIDDELEMEGVEE